MPLRIDLPLPAWGARDEEDSMHAIVVGLDGSDESRVALRWAAAYADLVGAPLHAVSAWQYPADSAAPIGFVDLVDAEKATARVEGELRAQLTELLGDAAGSVTTAAPRGPAADAILRAAEDQDAAMIVVGSRGRGGFKSLLLGSVSRQLCEHAPRPVTVVRRTAVVDPVRLGTIVVGTDGSPDAERAMTFAGDLATERGAELVVVHAVQAPEPVHPRFVEPAVDLEARREFAEAWCAPLKQRGIGYDLEVVQGDPRRALLDVARDRGADLLVVGSRGLGPLANVVLGSVATSLAQHADLPVTIVPRAA
jgi:nucleotide-binding universal stress UspA family protein